MRRFFHPLMIVLTLLSLSFISSCGSKQGGGGSNNNNVTGNEPLKPTNPTTPTITDCNEYWKKVVSENLKGTIKEYELRTETQIQGITTPTQNTPIIKQREEIVESTLEKIVTKRTVSFGTAPEQNSLDIRKAVDTINKCEELKKRGLPIDNSVQVGSTVLEQKEEVITVIAGTFNCNYTKTKSELTNGTSVPSPATSSLSINEFWIAKDLSSNILVKSVLRRESVVNKKPMVQITTMELTNYVQPR